MKNFLNNYKSEVIAGIITNMLFEPITWEIVSYGFYTLSIFFENISIIL